MSDVLRAPQRPETPLSDETVRLMVARALTSEQVSVVITRADNLYPIVWADKNFTALTGYAVDDAIGRPHNFLHGPGTDEPSVERLRRRMLEGATTTTVLLYRQGGTPFWDRLVAVPIRDDAGVIAYHAVIHTDATDDIVQEWTRAAEVAVDENQADRLALVTRVIGAMTEHVDYHRAAEALARSAIGELADWGILMLFDDGGGLDHLVVVAADPAKQESASIVEARLKERLDAVTWGGLPDPVHQVMNTSPGEPILPGLVDIGQMMAQVTSKDWMTALYDLGLGARLPVPLVTRRRRLGLLLLEARSPDRFDIPAVVTATQLRHRVTNVLDNIRLYQNRRPNDPTSPPRALRTGNHGQLVNDSAGMAIALRALRTAALPVLVSDTTTGQIVWANDPYCQMVGWSQAELIGRPWQTVHTEQPDEAYVTEKIDAFSAGSTVSMTLLCKRHDGTRFWSRMTVTPVRDSRGKVTHSFAVHAEATAAVVTEHVQAAEAELAANRNSRLELIAQAVDALTDQVDYHQAAEALARTVVPALADWGFVVLFDDDNRPEYFTDVVVADPSKQESARIAGQDVRGWFCQHCTLNATAQKAQPTDTILPSLVDVNLLAQTVPPRQVIDALQDLGMGAQLPVPLFARDRTLGMLVLEAHDPDTFDVPTVVTATLLRSRVGTVLDNIRLYQTERQTVLTLQHRLLPPTTKVDGLDTATVYRPSARAEIGGDWYDVFSLGDRGTMLAVGDVVGHDMAAAAAMGQLSVLLRARAWNSVSPGATLSIMVDTLAGMRWDDVASVVCLRWQPTDDGGCHLEYSNLGHSAPFVRLPDGEVRQMPRAHGLPLGLHDPVVDVGQDEFDLPAGSIVVLYTDGLVERRDRPLRDGLSALAQALRDAPDGTAEQIRDHLLATLVQGPPEDDLCLMVVRRQPGLDADLMGVNSQVNQATVI